ncbi:MAG: hypothetical protein RMJ51_01025 [Candidatus Calescibacterium sp.]|nr:hypothetical protein [Candidatus Calescibacterium sp.]MCX7972127.1 hypothetical protein [bacterium]MDW8194815.1 hypothetical protein [Candidatus Calescibacterium sp.]
MISQPIYKTILNITNNIITHLIFFGIIFFLYSCATGVPTLNSSIPSNKLLSISVFLKSSIEPTIEYEYNGQQYRYYFYSALLFRFDDNLISNNLDTLQHIFYFQNGFKRINRINPPSPNTSVVDEWSSIIIDNNSQIIGNELRFNILIPDDILGNKQFFKFIILVFLRDYEYSQISDDFGQEPVSTFENPSFAITINLDSIQQNTIYSLTNPNQELIEENLPAGFPEEKKNSLKIEKIEYTYRNF